MSGRLVSRCSVAGLWSEWEAWETAREATLAVSYVFLAAQLCCVPLRSLSFKAVGLSIIFQGDIFPWRSLATGGRGVFRQAGSPPAASSPSLLAGPTYCFSLLWDTRPCGNTVTCFCGMPAALAAHNHTAEQRCTC